MGDDFQIYSALQPVRKMKIKSHPHGMGVEAMGVGEIASLTLTYVGTYSFDSLVGSEDTG